MEEVPAEGWSGTRTAEVVGITYRQLDYWARTDLVRPAMADAKGSGTRRMYSYRNLLELKIIKQLLDAGIRLEVVRDVFNELRTRLGDDLTAAKLVISGASAMLALDDGELIDLVHKGQGVLNILALGTVQSEVDASISQLRPLAEDTGNGAGHCCRPPTVPGVPQALALDSAHRALGAKLVPSGDGRCHWPTRMARSLNTGPAEHPRSRST